MECSCKIKKITKRNNFEKETLIKRLNLINGQINGIKNMVEKDRYCDDILIQLSAIDKAIKSLANLMIEKHLKTCILNQIKEGHDESINEVIDLFKRFQ